MKSDAAASLDRARAYRARLNRDEFDTSSSDEEEDNEDDESAVYGSGSRLLRAAVDRDMVDVVLLLLRGWFDACREEARLARRVNPLRPGNTWLVDLVRWSRVVELCCEIGQSHILEVLENVIGRDLDINPVAEDTGASALHNACSKGHATVVEFILKVLDKREDSGDLQTRLERGKFGVRNETPLWSACQSGKEQVVELLLTRMVVVPMDVVLPVSIEGGHVLIVEMLCEWWWLKQRENDDASEQLLEMKDERGRTMREWVSYLEKVEVQKKMLAAMSG